MVNAYIFAAFLIILGLVVMRFGSIHFKKFKEGKTRIKEQLSGQISFIILFVLIIGLMDFLAVVTAATSDKDWLGRHLEGYIFVAMVLWVMLYTMSRYSKKLELRFNTENKN